jgi:hypothetical protein
MAITTNLPDELRLHRIKDVAAPLGIDRQAVYRLIGPTP